MALRIISTIVLVFEFIMRIGLFIMIVNEIKKNEEEKINMIEKLKTLQELGFKYIARDKNNNLYVYNEKPTKKDKEPYLISDLLGE